MDTIMDTAAWVTRPERPKGAKDEVKQARRAQSRPEGPQARSRAPEGPQTSSIQYLSDPGKPGVRSLGPSVTFVKLTNSILTDNANRERFKKKN